MIYYIHDKYDLYASPGTKLVNEINIACNVSILQIERNIKLGI